MCSVSWLRDSHGYRLFCNRDERRSRKAALPPKIQTRSDVKFIAPIDGDFGGSWIGVNEYGLALCLLNRYQDEYLIAPTRSRGLFLLELIDCNSSARLITRLNDTNLFQYQPFTLLMLALNDSTFIAHWTGRELRIEENVDRLSFLTSSSFETETVIASRKQYFQALDAASLNEETLLSYHRSHRPEPQAYSVCMHREDAQTVSFSHIAVAEKIKFDYYAQSPCQQGIPYATDLKLRAK